MPKLNHFDDIKSQLEYEINKLDNISSLLNNDLPDCLRFIYIKLNKDVVEPFSEGKNPELCASASASILDYAVRNSMHESYTEGIFQLILRQIEIICDLVMRIHSSSNHST